MRRGRGVVALVAAVGLTGCFGDSADSEGSPQAAKDTRLARGGTLTLKTVDDVETLDPGISSSVLSSLVLSLAHRPLYSYFPGDTRPDPDVASGQPEISADGRSVTVRLRRGVRFGAPVNREIRAEDVRYAIERVFTPRVPNGFATLLLSDLAGVEELKSGKAKHISGIEVPDAATIVFRLQRGTGAGFVGALGLLATAPVPEEYARRYDRGSVSTYGGHAPPTGPYRIDRHDPGRRIVLVRNPDWNPETDDRPAYPDRIEVEVGGDVNVVSRQIASGSAMVSGTFLPSRAVIRRLERENPKQIAKVSGVVWLLPLNTTRPPLDDVQVRQAIAAAIDRATLARLAGARFNTAASHFLPPGMPGFEEAGPKAGAEPHMREPAGDSALAKSLLQGAGGSPSRPLKFIAANDPFSRDMATSIVEDLRRIGVRTELRTFSEETVYTKFCTIPARKLDMCLIGFAPFPGQPQTLLNPLFNGRAITPTANTNMAQLDDPKINAALDAAVLVVDPHERAAAFGEVDSAIVTTAAAVPLLWGSPPILRSADVKGDAGPAGWDPAFLAVR